MQLYADSDKKPISQLEINNGLEIDIEPVKNIDIEYNVCYTVFDYEADPYYPPCVHFLDNFLTSEVYVFSVPLHSEMLQSIQDKNFLLKTYCSSFQGFPKTAVKGDFELGWVGVEKDLDLTIISNIQINGIYWSSITKQEHVKFYKTMVEFCKKQIDVDQIFVPTAKTLKTLSDRFSDHPKRRIMETPYTSKVLSGYKKTLLPNKKFIFANNYLSNCELAFYRIDS